MLFHHRAVPIVLAAAAIDIIGFGIVMPVLPALVTDLGQMTMTEATRPAGWLLAAFAVAQFFAGPVLGHLGDACGRRPVLIASMVAFGLDYALMAWAPTLAWLFLGRIIAGVAGAIFGPASSVIADVTPPDKRAAAFGWLGAAFGHAEPHRAGLRDRGMAGPCAVPRRVPGPDGVAGDERHPVADGRCDAAGIVAGRPAPARRRRRFPSRPRSRSRPRRPSSRQPSDPLRPRFSNSAHGIPRTRRLAFGTRRFDDECCPADQRLPAARRFRHLAGPDRRPCGLRDRGQAAREVVE